MCSLNYSEIIPDDRRLKVIKSSGFAFLRKIVMMPELR